MRIWSGIMTLVILVAALWMAGCATTEDKKAQADKEALCAVLDTNQDGKITKEEFMARTSDKAKGLKVFEQCDTGQKGYLTYDEVWSQRMILPPEIMFYTPPVVKPVR